MRVLLVSSRYPWPPYRGDRLRAAIWIEALRDHEVTLIAPESKRGAERVRYVPVRRSWARFLRDSFLALARGLPLQTLLAAGYDWQRALEQASARTEFDAEIVLLSRLHPWVFPSLRSRWKILDAVDSLSGSMAERARHGSPFMRPFWRREERKTMQLEREAPAAYDRVAIVSEGEVGSFSGEVEVISNGVEIAPLEPGERAFDFGFWGRLAYFANRDAVSFLMKELWPFIRAANPSARLVIAGADAPPAVLRYDGIEGVTVVSPAASIPQLARQIRVALFPVFFGTGQANKVLEAAEAGCAIVAAPQAVRGLEGLVPKTSVTGDAKQMAAEAGRLLRDSNAREEAARAAREIVMARYSRQATAAKLRVLVEKGQTQ